MWKVREGRECNKGKEGKESVCVCDYTGNEASAVSIFAVPALVIRSTRVT